MADTCRTCHATKGCPTLGQGCVAIAKITPQPMYQALAAGTILQMHSRRGALEVHEFDGTFQGSRAHFRMTSVIGHVYSLDFHSAFNSWDKVRMQVSRLPVAGGHGCCAHCNPANTVRG
jgi:hypothetical protein